MPRLNHFRDFEKSVRALAWIPIGPVALTAFDQ